MTMCNGWRVAKLFRDLSQDVRWGMSSAWRPQDEYFILGRKRASIPSTSVQSLPHNDWTMCRPKKRGLDCCPDRMVPDVVNEEYSGPS